MRGFYHGLLEEERWVLGFEKAGPYDVAPDGKRFLIVKAQPSPGQGQQNELQVVVNWLEELRRRAPFSK